MFNRLTIFVLIVGGALGWVDLILLPFMIGSVVDELGVSESTVGWLGAIEIGALTLTSFLIAARLHKVDFRGFAVLGIMLVILGNVLSIFISDFWQLCCSRILVGAGLGLIASIANALASLTAAPERTFALMQFGLASFASILIFLAPTMMSVYGLNGVFMLQIAVSVIVGALFFLLPARPYAIEAYSGNVEDSARMPVLAIFSLLSLACLFVGHSALWAFSERVADSLSIDSYAIGKVLAISAFLGLGGATFAYLLGMRVGYAWPVYAGFFLQLVLGFLMYSSRDISLYMTSVLFLNFGIVFVTPYMMSLLAEVDQSGRAPALGPAFVNVGSAIGPLYGSFAVATAGYAGVSIATALAFIVGSIIITLSMRSQTVVR
jgi:predicted MFS family arabinose efflux permease